VRVLVTGGAGYIGSHVCKALAAAGHEPVVYDNLHRGHRWAVRWGPLVEGDVRDAEALRAAFAGHRPDAVVHLAALAYVGESVDDPALYYDNNVAGSLALLRACADGGVARFVFSSSCAVYGIPARCPIEESFDKAPISPYGRSKLAVEWMLRDFDTAHGLKSVALRYFNAAGADPDGEIGEVHEPETHLLPLAIAAARGKLESLGLFGTDYPTPDGTAVRDYVHVSDLADAHVRALDYLHGGGDSVALNLGSGVSASVREVIAAAAEVVGREPVVVEQARRPGDPPMLTTEAKRAAALLGWKPRFTSLKDIAASACRWARKGPPAS
jgi:UDP-arabinose 4-epimerase